MEEAIDIQLPTGDLYKNLSLPSPLPILTSELAALLSALDSLLRRFLSPLAHYHRRPHIRQLAQVLSSRELSEWWELEIGWAIEGADAHPRIAAKLSWALERAKSSGWESREP